MRHEGIKQYSYDTNCANAKLRSEAGSTFVAKAIWTIGLPRLPPFATEQRDKRLSARDLEAVPEAIHSVLNWLHRVATALTERQTTKEVQQAVRKSGVARGESGLTANEQETRRAIRRAKCDIRTAKVLARQWVDHTLTARNWQRWQENLLRAYWNGSLDRRLEKVSRQGSGDTMCKSPVFTRPP